MSRWRQFRQLYPATIPIVLVLVLVDVLTYVFTHLAWLGISSGQPLPDGATEAVRDIMIRFRCGAFVILAVLSSFFRFTATYPVNDRAYLAWLRTTPWRIDRPLPLGPFLPSWQDAVVLGVLTVWALSGPICQPALVPGAFIGAYVVSATLALIAAKYWRYVLGSAVLFGVAAWLEDSQWMLGLAIVAAICLTHGLRHCWRGFHERGLYLGEAKAHCALIFQGPDAVPALQIDRSSGTIHHLLHGDKIEPIVSVRAAALLSILVGGIVWLTLRKTDAPDAAGAVVLLVLAVALLRWWAYLLRPPISLRGRWHTRRLIIPAYDRACLVPMAIASSGMGAWYVLSRLSVTAPVAGALAVTLAVSIAFGAGPTLGVHRLTGAQHYFVSRRGFARA